MSVHIRRPPWSTYPLDPDGCSDESRHGRRWASEIMLYIISPYSDCVRVDIASRRFLCNHGNIATEGSPHCVTVDVCDSWWYLELVFWNFGWKIGCGQLDGNVIYVCGQSDCNVIYCYFIPENTGLSGIYQWDKKYIPYIGEIHDPSRVSRRHCYILSFKIWRDCWEKNDTCKHDELILLVHHLRRWPSIVSIYLVCLTWL